MELRSPVALQPRRQFPIAEVVYFGHINQLLVNLQRQCVMGTLFRRAGQRDVGLQDSCCRVCELNYRIGTECQESSDLGQVVQAIYSLCGPIKRDFHYQLK